MSSKLTAAEENLLSPSNEFRKEAVKAVWSLGAFILVYFLMIALSLCFIALCVGAGVWVMTAKLGLITILTGIGIIGCGIMVFVFLIKFLFATTKTDESDCIEIHETDHPHLFQSIRSLTGKVGVPMPGKVFLSHDVNACVFYNSSFWSLFLPVRKNLKIGVGLINAINISELEAVMVHEFGHFSQRSMKVGSWVYQVNRVIYDMLFSNQRFAERLNSLANMHGILLVFGWLTSKIVEGIKWVLRQMYWAVNNSYLALSRHMEFQADLIAASVCGSNNVISALQRIAFANECYETAITTSNKAWQEKRLPSDFYTAHSIIIKTVGNKDQLRFDGDLPVFDSDVESSRVVFKNQWSSHPTLTERRMHLNSYGFDAAVNRNPAWCLFEKQVEVKANLTRILYRNIFQDDVTETVSTKEFEIWLNKELASEQYPPLFKGYYDQRQLDVFDVEAAIVEPIAVADFSELFDEEIAALPKKLRLLYQDFSVLQGISSGQIETKTFDFDGRKYLAKEAPAVIAQLLGELSVLGERLMESDCNIFRYFYFNAAQEDADVLKYAYQQYFEQRERVLESWARLNHSTTPIDAILQRENLEIAIIINLIQKFKTEYEPGFKAALSDLMPYLNSYADLKMVAEKFLQADYQYYHDENVFEHELQEVVKIVQQTWEAINGDLNKQVRGIAQIMARIYETIVMVQFK